MKRFFIIFIFSLLNGGLTSFIFAVCVGAFPIKGAADEMALITIFVLGFISATIFSPLAYWCLKDKNLVIIMLLLFISGIVVTALLSLYGHRIGLASPLSFLGVCFIFWILALLLSKEYAP